MSFITVAGVQDAGVDLSYASAQHPVIGCGSQAFKQGCNYAVTNNADTLTELIKQPDRIGRTIVAPRPLYAKYVWETGIECVPVFEDLREYAFDPMAVSEQQLALALACWMGSVSVFLLGYHLEKNTETPALKAIATLYPHTKFAFIRKPNPQRIGIFKDYANIIVEETPTFREMIKNVVAT